MATPKEMEEMAPAPAGYKWVSGPNGKGAVLSKNVTAEDAAARKEIPEFKVKNCDVHPRSVWPGSDGLLAPGEIKKVPAEHRMHILKQFADGHHKHGETEWGEPYKGLEISEEAELSAAEIQKRAEAAELKRQRAMGQAQSPS